MSARRQASVFYWARAWPVRRMRLCGLSRRAPELGPEPRLLREPLSGLSPTWPLEGLGSGVWASRVSLLFM
jgi:hypothetical protein